MLMLCYDRKSSVLTVERYGEEGAHIEGRVISSEIKLIDVRGADARIPLNIIDRDKVCIVVENEDGIELRGSMVVVRGKTKD